MKKNETLALIANIAIIVLGIIGIVQSYDVYSNRMFVYYTLDSNVLCVVSSTLFVVFMLIKKSQKDMPAPVMKLRYASTCCLAITFVVAITLLSIMGEGTYIENLIAKTIRQPFIYHHLLCPIISFISFIKFEGDRRLNKKVTIWWAIVPTIIYGLILIGLNVANIVDGPYPFLRINAQPIYMTALYVILILVCNYFISRFILLFNQMNAPRIRKDS